MAKNKWAIKVLKFDNRKNAIDHVISTGVEYNPSNVLKSVGDPNDLIQNEIQVYCETPYELDNINNEPIEGDDDSNSNT